MRKPVVLHLIDDASPGGVMRVVDHFLQSPAFADTSVHRVARLSRNRWEFDSSGVDLVVSHMTLNWRNFPTRTRMRAQHPGLAMVHVEHSYTQGFVAQKVLNRNRFYAMLRSGYGLFDHVVAVSRAQRDWVVARDLAPRGRISAIQSAVDLGPFAALPRPRSEARVFGLMGRLTPCKGFDIAIRAFRACPGTGLRLRIFGDGPERARLQALAASDPRITFQGHSNDPAAAMESIDALLVPSRWESFGLVACEALAARRQVIVAPTDGLRDHVEAGAFQVYDHSIPAWSAAIEEATRPAKANRPRVASCKAALSVTSRFERDWNRLFLSQPAMPVAAE